MQDSRIARNLLKLYNECAGLAYAAGKPDFSINSGVGGKPTRLRVAYGLNQPRLYQIGRVMRGFTTR